MWSPTHVQVTVQKARGLLTKGKNGTNDAFVTIGLGKEKYQTSVKEKATDNVEWHEKCELQIPKQGNTAEITLTALHHNFFGVDEFLGYVSIPLAGLDVYDRPKNRWYTLKDKPGRDKKKNRGELEVKVAFIVKAGSLADLSKKEKHKSSLGQVSQAFSSSLISISSLDKRKGLKKLASKIGHKMSKKSKDKGLDDAENSSNFSESQLSFDNKHRPSQQKAGDADPGVISEGESEDDFTLDDLSHKGSGYSLEIADSNSAPLEESLKNFSDHESHPHSDVQVPPSKPPRTIITTENKFDEWEQKLYGRHGRDGSNISPTNTLKRRLNGLSPLVTSTSEDKISTVHSPYLNETDGENYPMINAPKSEPSYSPQRMRQTVFSDNSVKKDQQNTDVRSSPTLSTSSKSPLERIIIGGETERISPSSEINGNRLSSEVLKKFDGKTREDLVEMILEMQAQINHQHRQQKDLEDYLDNLLLRVMETSPRILQNPYKKKS